MKTKMVALFLLAIMALGATGFAAAWWTAELKVTGTVTTGTFGMEWSPLSYKISGDSKNIITWPGSDPVYLTDYTTGKLHPQTLAIELQNVYPCTDLEIKGDMHYYGTVPGHIKDVDMKGKLNGVDLTDIPEWMFIEVGIEDISSELKDQRPALIKGSVWTLPALIAQLIGTQWHYCYEIDFLVYIHWIESDMTIKDPWDVIHGPFGPNIEVPMDAKLEFTLTVDVVQYNAP